LYGKGLVLWELRHFIDDGFKNAENMPEFGKADNFQALVLSE
jgi:hypothetical protein